MGSLTWLEWVQVVCLLGGGACALGGWALLGYAWWTGDKPCHDILSTSVDFR